MKRTLLDLTLYDPSDLPTCVPVTAPAVPAVYFVMSGPDVVYVGQTGDLQARLRDRKHPVHGGAAHEVRWQVSPDLDERLRLETIYIATWCPRENSAVLLRVSKGRLTEIRWKRSRRPRKHRLS